MWPLKLPVSVSFKEQPGCCAAVFYRGFDCNLDCFGCYNKSAGREVIPQGYTQQEFEECLEKLRKLGVQVLVLSGGEFLLYPDAIQLLEFIKQQAPWISVRVDTNGTLIEQIQTVIEHQLVSGLALDVKVPLIGYKREYTKLLFSVEDDFILSVKWYQERLNRVLSYLADCKGQLKFLVLRTVRSPLLDEQDLSSIAAQLTQYGLHKYWVVNEFISKEDLR